MITKTILIIVATSATIILLTQEIILMLKGKQGPFVEIFEDCIRTFFKPND